MRTRNIHASFQPFLPQKLHGYCVVALMSRSKTRREDYGLPGNSSQAAAAPPLGAAVHTCLQLPCPGYRAALATKLRAAFNRCVNSTSKGRTMNSESLKGRLKGPVKGMLLLAAIAPLFALSGCVVVPARGAYVAPPPVYVAPAPVYVGPRIWFRGRWVHRH
jgi:hypothetical protein